MHEADSSRDSDCSPRVISHSPKKSKALTWLTPLSQFAERYLDLSIHPATYSGPNPSTSNLPITSLLPLGAINEPIILFQGDALIHLSNGSTYNCNGCIKWRWDPQTGTFFEASIHGFFNYTGEEDLELEVPVLGIRVRGHLINLNEQFGKGKPPTAELRVLLEIQPFGDLSTKLTKAVFHLVNFPDYYGSPIVVPEEQGRGMWMGRVVLKSNKWEVILDSTKNQRKLWKKAANQRGNCITHVGEISRVDGRAFTPEEASEVIECLHYFFSFVRGDWSPPIVWFGVDQSDRMVYQDWSSPISSPCHSLRSWFDDDSAPDLTSAFSGMMEKWTDPQWRKLLATAIHIYIEANTSGTPETSIILSQAAWELLAWVYLVEIKEIWGVRTFEDHSAAERLRQLLGCAKIPVAIPPTFKNLATHFASASIDGPDCVTQIRNGVVHPSIRQKALGIPAMVRYEAANLSLTYVELNILFLLGYTGLYQDRCSHDPVQVPW